MLLDGEPGPGGLSAASPQSQAGGRGPRPPSGGTGEESSEESPKSKTEPPSRGSKALRDEDKAWVTRTEPQDHKGALTSVPWSTHQAVTGPPPGAGLSLPLEARRSRCSGRSRRMGREHHSIPQPGGDSPHFQVPKGGSTVPEVGGSLPLPVGCCRPWLLFSTALFPFLPSLFPTSPPSMLPSILSSMSYFHASLSCSLPPSCLSVIPSPL